MLARNIKVLFAGMIVALSLMLIVGCAVKDETQETGIDAAASQEPVLVNGVGGIIWHAPAGWTVGPEKPMRAITYFAKAADGDVDSAECAVFYFGQTSGGTTADNITRWANQLTQPDGSSSLDKATTDEFNVGDVKVTTVDVTGSYTVPAGPMMQATDNKEDYRLLGAVCEGPQGSVFFKMTGPANTMAANETSFMGMIKSIVPEAK